jgi:tetratricopeptide (TPR) repeat protein
MPKVVESGKDLYKILEVEPDAKSDEIRRAYFRLAKRFHPDLSAAGNNDENTERFLEIQKAYEVLSKPTKRLEYDESFGTGTTGEESVIQAERGPSTGPRPKWVHTPSLDEIRDARKAFSRIPTLLEHEDYDRAVEVLRVIVKTVPNEAEYQSMFGYVLALGGQNLHKARDYCRRAVQSDPYNADFHAQLGFVYLRAGLTRTAQECFDTALTYDPQQKIALANQNPEKSGGGLMSKISRFFGL